MKFHNPTHTTTEKQTLYLWSFTCILPKCFTHILFFKLSEIIIAFHEAKIIQTKLPLAVPCALQGVNAELPIGCSLCPPGG